MLSGGLWLYKNNNKNKKQNMCCCLATNSQQTRYKNVLQVPGILAQL